MSKSLLAVVCCGVFALAVLLMESGEARDCNAMKEKGESKNCQKEVLCPETQIKEDCLKVDRRKFAEKGNFTCIDGAQDSYCGDITYQCYDEEAPVGVKCTCAWKCKTNFAFWCVEGEEIMELDLCTADPDDEKQVCSYQKEKKTQGCQVPSK